VEYDNQGQELSKTVLTSGQDNISIGAFDLELAADGTTWLVAGQMYGTNYTDPGGLGWAAAVRDGDVLWTFESAPDVKNNLVYPLGSFTAVAHSTDVLLGGRTASTEGVRRWAVRLDAQSGTLIEETIGAPVEVGPDVYHGGARFGEQAVFVGRSEERRVGGGGSAGGSA